MYIYLNKQTMITKQKTINKFIHEISETIDSYDEGYEMGCLISAEFTPAPDYFEIVEMIDEGPYTIDEILEHLEEMAKDEYDSESPRGDLSYTKSGYLMNHIHFTYECAKEEMKRPKKSRFY